MSGIVQCEHGYPFGAECLQCAQIRVRAADHDAVVRQLGDVLRREVAAHAQIATLTAERQRASEALGNLATACNEITAERDAALAMVHVLAGEDCRVARGEPGYHCRHDTLCLTCRARALLGESV